MTRILIVVAILEPCIFARTVKSRETTLDVPFVIIFFRGKSSDRVHGVELQVSDKGTNNTTFRPKMVSLDVNEPSFDYKFPPLPLIKYGANERLFILVNGVIGMRTRVKITDFNSEACCDYLKAPYLDLIGDSTFTAYT